MDGCGMEYCYSVTLDLVSMSLNSEGEDSCNEPPAESNGFNQCAHRQRDLASGGRQASRHRPLQLVPDGLNSGERLDDAKCVNHPFYQGR